MGLWYERHSEYEEGLTHHQMAEDLLSGEPLVVWVDAVAGKARCLEALGDLRYAVFLLESLLDRLEREQMRDPDALSRLHASLVGRGDREAASDAYRTGIMSLEPAG